MLVLSIKQWLPKIYLCVEVKFLQSDWNRFWASNLAFRKSSFSAWFHGSLIVCLDHLSPFHSYSHSSPSSSAYWGVVHQACPKIAAICLDLRVWWRCQPSVNQLKHAKVPLHRRVPAHKQNDNAPQYAKAAHERQGFPLTKCCWGCHSRSRLDQTPPLVDPSITAWAKWFHMLQHPLLYIRPQCSIVLLSVASNCLRKPWHFQVKSCNQM